MQSKLFVIILAYFGRVSGSPSVRSNNPLKIINGQEVTPHSMPFEAYLIFFDSNGGGWSCGGAIISQNYILTAGQCTHGASKGKALLGIHDLKADETTFKQEIQFEKIIVHDRFDEGADIGMVKLAQPANLTQYVQTIGLPGLSVANQSIVGQSAIIAGWGLIDTTVISNVLRSANVTPISNNECKTAYRWLDTSTFFCTLGNNDQGTCSGDAGSPVMINSTVYGITSSGPIGCKGGPDIFTRVAVYLDWIRTNSDVTIPNQVGNKV